MKESEIERAILEVATRLEARLQAREEDIRALEQILVEHLDAFAKRWSDASGAISAELQILRQGLDALSKAYTEHLSLHGPSSGD
jgi:uncharacterized protein YPO0396